MDQLQLQRYPAGSAMQHSSCKAQCQGGTGKQQQPLENSMAALLKWVSRALTVAHRSISKNVVQSKDTKAYKRQF